MLLSMSLFCARLQLESASSSGAVVSFGDCGKGLSTGLPAFPTAAGIKLDAKPQPVHCFEALSGSEKSQAWRNVTATIAPASSFKCAVQLRLVGSGSSSGGDSSVIRAVRYAYADRPLLCNLYSSVALPAVPFTSAGGS
jgi:hypothetical protein